MARQDFKGKKRLKSWYRGRTEADRWQRVARLLPDVDSGADPTAGAPSKPRTVGNRNRGDAA